MTDQLAAADASSELGGFEGELRHLQESWSIVPTPEQFEAVRRLAARLEVIVHPAQHEASCLDTKTGKAVSPVVAAAVLKQAEPSVWSLNAAQTFQARLVASVSARVSWRHLGSEQRRALVSWRLQHPELTYADLMTLGPVNARARLVLNAALLQPVNPAAPTVASSPAEDSNVTPVAPAITRAHAATTAHETSKRVWRWPFHGHGTSEGLKGTANQNKKPHRVRGDGAAGQAIMAAYADVEGVDTAAVAEITASGLHPPTKAKGYIKFDPYGTVNTLNEAVISYFDKIELRIPDGGMHELSQRIAAYNGYGADQLVEFPAGQYIWFPGRTVLQQWTHDIVISE